MSTPRLSTRLHEDGIRLVNASFDLEFTLFLARLVGSFLGGGDNTVDSGNAN